MFDRVISAAALTPSDTTTYNKMLGIRVGDITGGAVLVVELNGVEVTYQNVAAGEKFPGQFTKVKAATTCGNVVGHWG